MTEKVITEEEVAKHNTPDDLWLTIHDKVYDISEFLAEHPGGDQVLIDIAGQDGTVEFDKVGHSDDAWEIMEPLVVGVLKTDPAKKAEREAKRKKQEEDRKKRLEAAQSGDSALQKLMFPLILILAALALAFFNRE